MWEKRIPFTAMKNIACHNHYSRAHIRTKTFIVFPTLLSMLEHYEDNQIELSKQFDNQMEGPNVRDLVTTAVCQPASAIEGTDPVLEAEQER